MHTVAVRADGQTKYVTIFFQRADDLKRSYQALSEVRFLGKVLPEQVANVVGAGKADTLAWSIWDLRVFGGADTMSESFAIALSFIDSYLGDGGASWASAKGQGGSALKLYSLFDILREQDFQSMVDFRERVSCKSAVKEWMDSDQSKYIKNIKKKFIVLFFISCLFVQPRSELYAGSKYVNVFEYLVWDQVVANGQTFWIGSRWVLSLGFGSGPKPKTEINFGLN